MHIVIYGPPGTGKTEIAEMLENIFITWYFKTKCF